jgi:hypothetical protein
MMRVDLRPQCSGQPTTLERHRRTAILLFSLTAIANTVSGPLRRQRLRHHIDRSLSEDGELAGHTVECGWHCGQFDIRTGKAVASPCAIDLRTYQVEVREGRLVLRF